MKDIYAEERELLKPFITNIPDIVNQAFEILQGAAEYEASVYVLLVKSNQGKYILKLSNDAPIFHEAFVGFYGTNRIGSPNFAKILGVQPEAQCPVSSDFFYRKGDYCSYVIYEYIEGPTLKESLLTLDTKSLKKIYKELFHALRYAYNSVGFVHYDLHTRNIIIRKDHPVVIDYGRSKIDCDYAYYHYPDDIIPNEWSSDILTIIQATKSDISMINFHQTESVNIFNLDLTERWLGDQLAREDIDSDLKEFAKVIQELEDQLFIAVNHYNHEEFLMNADKILS